MRILVLSNLFPPHILGGYEILCSQVCSELRRLGHTVRVLTSDHGVETGALMADAADVSRILPLYLPFDRPASRSRARRALVGERNYRTTRDEIAAFCPDVIFIWSLLRLTVGPARAAQDSGVPVAYTFNDENLHSYQAAPFAITPRAGAAWMLDRILARTTLEGLRFESATCISARLKSNLLERDIAVESAQVIYQGIPIEQFPLKERPGEIHRTPRLLYAGQLHAYKGVHTLIAAANQLAAEGYDFQVTIVGEGQEPYRSELHRLAARGTARIEFEGKRAHHEMAQIYRDHDILIFPSIWPEPFGLTHLEAMASGTPVISTANGGQGEFLRHEENALIFAEENADQLAQSITRLMEDAPLARHLACHGRQTVEERFTLSGYVRRLETFLHQVAEGEDR